MFVCAWVYVSLCTMYVQEPMYVRRGHQMPWNTSHTQLVVNCHVCAGNQSQTPYQSSSFCFTKEVDLGVGEEVAADACVECHVGAAAIGCDQVKGDAGQEYCCEE